MRDRLWAALREEQLPYAVALFDVDLFKPFREEFGEGNAAEAAALISKALSAAAPKGGSAFERVGEDTFMAVFPGATLARGLAIAERMRAAVGRTDIRLPGVGSVAASVSAGVVEVTGLRSTEDVLAAAEASLRVAKESGRNCVAAGDFVDLLRDARSVQMRHAWQPRRDPPPIGRASELASLEALLDTERFVTLTGPAGAGKTRLAAACAARLAERFPDGIFLVRLDETADPAVAAVAIAEGLGVRQSTPATAIAALASLLRTQRALLLLDDCSQTSAPVASLVASLLEACPEVCVLATARSPLGALGERVFPVSSLHPDDAAAFFSSISPSPNDEAAVRDVCRRLAENPFAIEIAALTPRDVPLVAFGASLPERRDGDAFLAWRFALLEDEQRALLPRLAIFTGGWTGSDAAAVCNVGGAAIPAALRRLAESRLVVAELSGTQTRYRLPREVRLRARAMLESSGEYPELARRHAEHFSNVVTTAAQTWSSTPSDLWIPALESELENIRQALRWCIDERHAPVTGARLACGLYEFWKSVRLVDEGIAYLQALARETSLPEVTRAAIAVTTAILMVDASRPRDALPIAQRAAKLAAAAGEPLLAARAAYVIARSQIESLSDPKAGLAGLTRALEMYEKAGNRQGQAETNNAIGICYHSTGDVEPALQHYGQALRLFRSLGIDGGASSALSNIGALSYLQGDYQKAECYFHECLVRNERHASVRRLDMALLNLGEVNVTRGRLDAGRSLLIRAAHLLAIAPDEWVLAMTLSNLARVRLSAGEPRDAVRLAAFADKIFERLAQPRQPTQERIYREMLAAARAQLGDAFDDAYLAGRSLTTEAAIEIAASASSPASFD